jgi:anti-sigma B factor antagonist
MSNSISIAVDENVVTATIAGKIDGQSAPQLQARLLAALSDSTFAIFDVSQVTYMSSAGFRLLLLLYRTLSLKGGEISIVGLVDEIRDTMEMTGFLDFFVLHNTVEEALKKVRSHANYVAAR